MERLAWLIRGKWATSLNTKYSKVRDKIGAGKAEEAQRRGRTCTKSAVEQATSKGQTAYQRELKGDWWMIFGSTVKKVHFSIRS
jgi:hypothetical protein